MHMLVRNFACECWNLAAVYNCQVVNFNQTESTGVCEHAFLVLCGSDMGLLIYNRLANSSFLRDNCYTLVWYVSFFCHLQQKTCRAKLLTVEFCIPDRDLLRKGIPHFTNYFKYFSHHHPHSCQGFYSFSQFTVKVMSNSEGQLLNHPLSASPASYEVDIQENLLVFFSILQES